MSDPQDTIQNGYHSFDDFVKKQNYEYGPSFSEQSLKQNPEFAHGGSARDSVYAAAIAKNIHYLNANSVALNQTVNTGVVALAEKDPSDPNSGQIHYVAFVQGDSPRTYMFTENVSINADGTVSSQMEQGEGWDSKSVTGEQSAFMSLVNKFSDAASQPAVSLIDKFEAIAGKELAKGGYESAAGEYEVRADGSNAAVASAADLNQTTGIEIESSYAVNGDAQIKLSIFRENANGITELQSTAPGVDSAAKYNAFSSMSPGINRLEP